jgi:hypothetical protein
MGLNRWKLRSKEMSTERGWAKDRNIKMKEAYDES